MPEPSIHAGTAPADRPRTVPESPREDDFIEARMRQLPPEPAPASPPQAYIEPKKRKSLAVLLSVFIPGTGQFYLGLMSRGLIIMLLIILDIVSIVYLVLNSAKSNLLLITLLSLLLPVIYFYSIFESAHQTDAVNRANAENAMRSGGANAFGGSARDKTGSSLAWLILVGGFFLLISANGNWLRSWFPSGNGYVAAVILLLVGAGVYILDSRKR